MQINYWTNFQIRFWCFLEKSEIARGFSYLLTDWLLDLGLILINISAMNQINILNPNIFFN